MNKLEYHTDLGYGIRVMRREANFEHPAGFIVEVHFYNKNDADNYASELIMKDYEATSAAFERNAKRKGEKCPK